MVASALRKVPTPSESKKEQSKLKADAPPQQKKIGVQNKFISHFQERGFDPSQITKAIVVHEILGILMLGKE
jgi:hypothetical protein